MGIRRFTIQPMKPDLIDEYQICFYPVIAESGLLILEI